jgi:hypothetical protein
MPPSSQHFEDHHGRRRSHVQRVLPTGHLELVDWKQGFKPQWSGDFLKLFLKCHIEKMQGSFRENQLCCSKESSYTEHGLQPNPKITTGAAEATFSEFCSQPDVLSQRV